LVWPVSVALAAAMVYALFLYLPTRTPSTSTPHSVAAPGVHQADWKLATFPAGGVGTGHLSKQAKARVKAQREPLVALVEDVYDAMFLAPDNAQKVVHERFEAAAGASVLAKKIGLPAGVEEVKITKRSARIGIYVQGAKTAAARVKVIGSAVKNGHRSAFKHESTLWLERTDRAWKIIGFDVSQGPKT
jgi:hypothetical protein